MEERLFKKDKTVTLAGRYKLVRDQVLGEGSFAVVYKGLDVKECRNVAIKVYKGSDEQVTDMFKKSIEVLKTLNRHGRNSLRESLMAGEALSTSTYTSETEATASFTPLGSKKVEEERPRGMLLSPRRCVSKEVPSTQKSPDTGMMRQVTPTSTSQSSSLRPVESPALTPRLDDRGAMNRSSFQGSLLEEDLQTISSQDAKFHSAISILSMMDWGRCFVKLLSHSRNASLDAGLDPQHDVYFLVFELGEGSLEDTLHECAENNKTLSVQELRDLQWALVSIVCGLHSEGFVHLDIKPKNVMKFTSKDALSGGKVTEYWKLIDLDGAMRTGQTVSFEELVFTPEYVSPELAKAHTAIAYNMRLERKDTKSQDQLRLSRLMDIWSVGMCALEAIFLQPVLEPWYQEWKAETGSDEKFFRWLADYETDAVLSGDMRDAIADIDSEMCAMLEGMLHKDPQKRVCVAHCITHRWFQPIRDKILEELRERNNFGKDMAEASSLLSAMSGSSCLKSDAEAATPRSGGWKPASSTASTYSLGRVTKHSMKVAKVASQACTMM